MYCCVKCGRSKQQHLDGEVGACSQYDEGGRAFKCRAGVCIHPINCTRRQECLSIKGDTVNYSMTIQVDADTPPDTIIFKDRAGKEVGRIEGIKMAYGAEEFPDGKGRQRHGAPEFYALLEKMAETHDKKSHDYASNDNPFGNYHFAGMLSKLFDNPDDAGFIGRLGEKFYRLANLENAKKEVAVKDEGVADTENDIAVITLLWIVDRRQRRAKQQKDEILVCQKCKHQALFHNYQGSGKCAFCDCTATPPTS